MPEEKSPSTGQRCHFCKESLGADLDDPDAIYREVMSWVTGPKMQSPVLRTATGRVSHASCVSKLTEGQAPDQDPLPGLEE